MHQLFCALVSSLLQKLLLTKLYQEDLILDFLFFHYNVYLMFTQEIKIKMPFACQNATGLKRKLKFYCCICVIKKTISKQNRELNCVFRLEGFERQTITKLARLNFIKRTQYTPYVACNFCFFKCRFLFSCFNYLQPFQEV